MDEMTEWHSPHLDRTAQTTRESLEPGASCFFHTLTAEQPAYSTMCQQSRSPDCAWVPYLLPHDTVSYSC